MTTSTSTAPTAPMTNHQHDNSTIQNDQPATTTSTPINKITVQYTPRHHDLLVILTDPAGSVGCVLCAITMHADDAVVDCGLGPEHRDCHDHEQHVGFPC